MRASTCTADSSSDRERAARWRGSGRAGRRRRRARPDACSRDRGPRAARARGRSRPCRPGGARPSRPPPPPLPSAVGSTESRSPTTTSTRRPSATAWCSPESAATTSAVSGRPSSASGPGGSPPANTSAMRRSSAPAPRAVSPIGPSAGITRFRFEGSATRDGRPLSPADPSSPGILMSPASTAAQLSVQARSRYHRTRADCGDGSRNRDRAGTSRRDGVERVGAAHVVHRPRAHRPRL